MRRGILALLAVAVSGPALAADLPPRERVVMPAAAPVYAPAYNWSGFYIGAHLGGVWSDDTSTNITGSPLAPAGVVNSSNSSSFLGGGQAGFNYQFNSWVLGIEVDGSWTDLSASTTRPTLVPGTNVRGIAEVDSFMLLTGRLGYAANNWLFYVKGGGAWMNVDYTAQILAGAAVVASTTINDTRTGWTVGFGLEYGFWDNWSAKLEYNFIDFDVQRYNFPIAGAISTVDIDSQVHLFKAGLNYRLNWGAPMAAPFARY